MSARCTSGPHRSINLLVELLERRGEMGNKNTGAEKSQNIGFIGTRSKGKEQRNNHPVACKRIMAYALRPKAPMRNAEGGLPVLS